MHVNATESPIHFQPHANLTSTIEGRSPPLDFGNEGFMVFTTSLLWILVPGCGFFYSGMARSKSALSMMTMSLWAISIVSVQWFICGYSLAFSLTSGSRFIGDFRKAFYIGVKDGPYPTAKNISEISFCFYQGVTATLPAALISGALAERAKIMPALLFILLWNTLVYCPCSFWSLNPNGWSYNMGVLDFGGGAPVHVPASAAAAVYSYFLGPRLKEDIEANPHNMFCILIGTVLIWFGSFGYNAGSAFGANIQAVFSCIITNLSGAIGALTWSLEDYVIDGKCDAFGFCMGAVVGLIVITPASGFIHPASAFPIAIIGSTVCRWGHEVNRKLAYDDALDVFATHGLAGIVGILLAGVFAQSSYGGEDVEGWVDGNFFQILYQLEDTIAGCAWSTLVSIVILWIMNKVPYLKLRLDDLHAIMDEEEMGMMCYEFIEDIREQVDTATWKIPPEVKVTLSPELIMSSQTAITIQQNGNRKSIHHKNIESPSDENEINEKNIVTNGSWQNYWY